MSKISYSTADANGWSKVCDDLFLARYRGRPCEICGATSGIYAKRLTRSMGHHLLEKGSHRKFRYDPENIVTLCPAHHLSNWQSPHANEGVAIAFFYEWLHVFQPEKYALMFHRREHAWAKEWTYREMYQRLGGEVFSKTGLKKDLRPYKHEAKKREAEGR